MFESYNLLSLIEYEVIIISGENSNQINPEMLQEVEKKTGISSEELKKAANTGDLSNLVKNLGKDNTQKIEKILSDKESAMKLLSTPKAKALLKKLLGGK